MTQITIQILMIHVYTMRFSVSKTFLFLSVSSSQLDYSTHTYQWYGLVLFPFLTAMTGSGNGKQQARVSKVR